MQLRQINDMRFNVTLNKITSCDCLPAKGQWKCKRILKWLGEEMKLIEETRQATLKKYVELNEQGEPVIKPNTNNEVVFLEGKQAEFVKEFDEFLDTELEIKARFHYKEIKVAKLTGQDLFILDELLFDLTEAELDALEAEEANQKD